VLGVVFAFAYPDDDGDFFAWAEGCGPLRRNGREVAAALPDELGPLDVVLVSSGGDRDPETNLRCAAPARFRAVPSIAHRLALVAAGEAAAATSLFAPSAWDYGAGQALLRASGAVLLDEHGDEVAYDATGMSRTTRAFGARPGVARALLSRGWDALHGGASGGGAAARLERGRAVADSRRLARAQGCFFGQVAGDSLGSQVEFETAAAIASAHPDGVRALVDGGRWQTLAGQPTDDSEMALALGSLDPGGGRLRAGRRLCGLPRVVPQPALRRRQHHARRHERLPDGAEPGERLAHARGAARRAGARRDRRAGGRVGQGRQRAHPPASRLRRRGGRVRGRGGGRGRARRRAPCVDGGARLGARRRGAGAGRGGARGRGARGAAGRRREPGVGADRAPERVPRPAARAGPGGGRRGVGGARRRHRHQRRDRGCAARAVHGREAVPAAWRALVLSCRAHPLRARHARPRAYWATDLYELSERVLLAGDAAAAR
jgi:hypothetical protein